MNVTVIADAKLPIPPKGYGGTERIVALLCEGLVKRGHRVTLVATADSRRYGRLIAHRPPDNSSYLSRAYRKLLFQPLSALAAMDADVVHNFGRVDYLWGLLKSRMPLVNTFPNPIAEREVQMLRRARGPTLLVGISDVQRKGFHGTRWRTVYNAADVERLPFHPNASSPPYLAFLGRLTPNKGVHLAIQIARSVGMPLKIAGNIAREEDGQAYFDEAIRPQLRDGIEWIGEVGDREKPELLGGATALLFPIQWDEPFGIVMAEALASGTPVIATRRGSTSELVTHGETGFLADSVEELTQATLRVSEIDRAACRAAAEKRFSADAMVDHYLALYQQLISERP